MPRYTPPWLFLLLLLPVGATSGHALVALPYILPKCGLSVGQTAELAAISLLPYSWKLLWTPLLDLWIRRRDWHVLGGLLAAVGTALACAVPPRGHLRLLEALLFCVNAGASTSLNALGCLCAVTVRPDLKGRASGFLSAGQLSWSGLTGGMILGLYEPPPWLARVLPPLPLPTIGLLLGALMAGTTLLALVIDEPAPARRPIGPHLMAVLRDAWGNVRSRAGWTGLLICLAPVGTAAASNVFGTLAREYGADAGLVNLATGLPAGLASAAGALLGGFLADRVHRRAAYLSAGGLTAACALGMALAPPTPGNYVFWCLAYAVGAGLSYATFYAFVFELIGPTDGAGTTYGLYAGAANLAIVYVTWLDGQMHAFGGRRGLLGCDAALGVLGIALVLTVLAWVRRRDATPPLP